MLKRGDIWLANLNPPHGTEPGKRRPVLIVQSQTLLNINHPSTLIIPLTTSLIDNAEPLRIRIPASGKLKRSSDLIIDQLRAIDNRRLVQGPLAHLPNELMCRIGSAILEVFDLSESALLRNERDKLSACEQFASE